jgi:hypothetical protein
MLGFTDLRRMAKARVADAKSLISAGRYDGAAYIVGYGVEYMLKARIATGVLGKRGWPETKDEFDVLKGLSTHDLEKLLRISGRESKVLATRKSSWSFVLQNWRPTARYSRVGTFSRIRANDMCDAVENLLKIL